MYKFTEEQIMIRDMVREFTKNEVAPYDKAMDETFSFNMEVYQQIYSKLVETGLMGIPHPRAVRRRRRRRHHLSDRCQRACKGQREHRALSRRKLAVLRHDPRSRQ